MGQSFGNYEVLRRIAAGGMAEVFLAKHRGMGGFERLVCIKRILPHLSVQQDFVNMFMDEARIAANLLHPNIAQIYDVGQVEGSHYIAMEYVRGEDLRHVYNQEVARGRPMPPEPAAQIAMGAASGLDYAHRQTNMEGRPLNIVHRDISPQNILVTYDGHVKLVDFGVAKAAGKVTETRTGVLKGKYSYMSPEQASGDPIDSRTDIFALGITLFEVTTGQRLFKRDNEIDTLHAVIECRVPHPTVVLPGYDPALEAIVLRALRSDPDARYQTAGELAVALERYLIDRGHPTGAQSLGSYMQDLFAEKLADDLLFGGQTWDERLTPSARFVEAAPAAAPVERRRAVEPTHVLAGRGDDTARDPAPGAPEPTEVARPEKGAAVVGGAGGEAAPATTARPDATTRPDATNRPDATARPDAVARPDLPARPDATIRADVSARPDTTSRSAETARAAEAPAPGGRAAPARERHRDDWGASTSTSEPATTIAPAPAPPRPAEPLDTAVVTTRTPRPAARQRFVVGLVAALLVALGALGGVVMWRERPRRSGPLAVESEPRGARVLFSGPGSPELNQRYGLLATPFQVREGVPVGAGLRARFTKDGFDPVERDLPRLVAGVTPGPLFAELSPSPEAATTGVLVLITDPPGATVRLDGAPVEGRTPLSELRVRGGEHRVELLLAGYRPRLETPYVEPGSRKFVQVALSPESAGARAGRAATTAGPEAIVEKPERGRAWLTVTAPLEMHVFLGPRLLGTTPLRRVAVEPGSHALRLQSDAEGLVLRRKVHLEPGATETVDLKLERAFLAVNATPWAWVRLGQRPPAETPARLQVYAGEYQVVFECEGGQRKVETARVEPGATATVAVSCQPEPP